MIIKKKKYISIFAALMFSCGFFALDYNSIENVQLDNIDYNSFNKSRVIVETVFGEKQILNPEVLEELVGKEILKVNLIYTTYKEADAFSQKLLNKARWEELHEIFPALNKMEDVQLVEIGNEKCNTRDCASDQLHGFVIEYKTDLLGYENLDLQVTQINGDHAKTIVGNDGTTLEIPADAFVDIHGNPVTGVVDVHLREALSAEDIVTANLVTITKQNQALESGGMIQVTAYQNGKQLQLQSDKSIGVSIPREKDNDGMMVWEGRWDEGELKWDNPQETIEEDPEPEAPQPVAVVAPQVNSSDRAVMPISGTVRRKGIARFVERLFVGRRFSASATFSEESRIEASANTQEGKASKELRKKIMADETLTATFNTFQMQGLGWANIDRFMKIDNSKKTNLEIVCSNDENMEYTYVTLMIPGWNVFLPGKKLPSGNYCFAFDNCASQYSLPKGEQAFIVLYGKSDEKTFSTVEEVKLGDVNVLETALVEKSEEDVLKEIKEII